MAIYHHDRGRYGGRSSRSASSYWVTGLSLVAGLIVVFFVLSLLTGKQTPQGVDSKEPNITVLPKTP